MRDERAEWEAYLESLPERGYSATQVTGIRSLWQRIVGRYGATAPLPVAGRWENALCVEWSTETHRLDVDFFCDGQVEWFFRNRLTEEPDGTVDEVTTEVPDAVLDRFAEIVAAYAAEGR